MFIQLDAMLSRRLVWTFDRRLGNCFVFNSDFDSRGERADLKKTHVSGVTFSLDLDLYVNYHEDLAPFAHGLGAIIRIDNISHTTDQNLNGVYISSGVQSFITVDRSFSFMLPKPYSSCEIDNEFFSEFDSHLYKVILHSPYQYSRTFCFHQCYYFYV